VQAGYACKYSSFQDIFIIVEQYKSVKLSPSFYPKLLLINTRGFISILDNLIIQLDGEQEVFRTLL
jgi:hypothetical protein